MNSMKLCEKGMMHFDFKRIFAQLFNFMTVELSAFYFDIRKDALYCDPPSSVKRKAALYVVSQLFDHLVRWLAPMMPFTMEESFQSRLGSDMASVHMEQFPEVPAAWKNDDLVAKWRKIRNVRRVVTGALEIERREKRIGSSLEAAPVVHITDSALMEAIEGQDMAEICITSSITVTDSDIPSGAFALEEVPGVGLVPSLAEGRKCARSWKVLPEVGSDPDYPDIRCGMRPPCVRLKAPSPDLNKLLMRALAIALFSCQTGHNAVFTFRRRVTAIIGTHGNGEILSFLRRVQT